MEATGHQLVKLKLMKTEGFFFPSPLPLSTQCLFWFAEFISSPHLLRENRLEGRHALTGGRERCSSHGETHWTGEANVKRPVSRSHFYPSASHVGGHALAYIHTHLLEKSKQDLRTPAGEAFFPETGSPGDSDCWPFVPPRRCSSLRSSSAAGSLWAP